MILKSYEKICELALKLPGNRLVSGQPEVWQMVVYYGVLMLVIGARWHWKGKKQAVLYGIVLFNLFIMFIPFERIIAERKGEIQITMLDVGQGDALFIKDFKGNTYLIDSGSSDVKKVGKYRIEPFLKSQGVGKIDYVFVSHGDGDHINGIVEMIGRKNVGISIETIVFPSKRVWDEELMELAKISIENGIRVVQMKAGQTFTEGEMTLQCLAPADDYKGDSNAGSMVLALSYKKFDMLFTGDVEKEGEERVTEVLNQYCQGVTWEVLKVAHHGSKNSTSKEFLESILPSYAFISAGRENLYGHPHKETMERLMEAKSTILSTQENGAITIITDGTRMKVDGYVKK